MMLSPFPSLAMEAELIPAFSLRSLFFHIFVDKHLPQFIVADTHFLVSPLLISHHHVIVLLLFHGVKYHLGALEIFDGIYDIDTVRMTIYQPRKSNISIFEMSKDALLTWADTELTEKARLAYEGQGNFSCGEWCRFCKAKAECRERAIYNLRLAQYDFLNPALLQDEEIADILGRIDALTSWASDVKEYALQQAISGKEWTGWKLVEGRSNRKYTSEADVAAAVESVGLDPYERKVLGVTAMQKLLGKTRFEELLSPYIEKPQGKPTLVPESDKTSGDEYSQKRFYGGILICLTTQPEPPIP